jgi:hypothetical protein
LWLPARANNVLVGGGGADVIAGGQGSDRFDYNAIGESGDNHFRLSVGIGNDKLDLKDICGRLRSGDLSASGFCAADRICRKYERVSRSRRRRQCLQFHANRDFAEPHRIALERAAIQRQPYSGFEAEAWLYGDTRTEPAG